MVHVRIDFVKVAASSVTDEHGCNAAVHLITILGGGDHDAKVIVGAPPGVPLLTKTASVHLTSNIISIGDQLELAFTD